MPSKNIYSSPLCSCRICRTELSQKAINTHFVAKHTNLYKQNSNKGTTKFQLLCSCIICHKSLTVQNLDRHISKHLIPVKEKKCPKCNKNHFKQGLFCSRSCGNSRTHTQETNNSRSLKLKGKLFFTPISYCVVCDKLFVGNKKTCSKQHAQFLRNMGASKGGKISSAKQAKRSKLEIELYNICLNYFTIVTHNDPIFDGWDADILIHDIKTAILWNGPWHYKEMPGLKHSLKQVQNRDKIKKLKIESFGWTCLIFEDQHYTPLQAFNEIILRIPESNRFEGL